MLSIPPSLEGCDFWMGQEAVGAAGSEEGFKACEDLTHESDGLLAGVE